MTISRVSHAIANGDNLAMPSHQAGDLIIAIAYRNDSVTIPSEPSGYRTVRSAGASTNSIRVSDRIAESSSESFGTWTNATQVAVLIYRDTTNYLMAGPAQTAAGTTDTITYGVLAAASILSNTNYWIATAAGYRANNSSALAAPSGMTNIDSVVGSSAGALTIHDTNEPVASFSAATVAGSSLTAWRSLTIEIFDTRIPKSAAPAALPTLRGGFSN